MPLNSSSRRPVMAGNWKLFKTHLEALNFAKDLDAGLHQAGYHPTEGPEIILCAPFTALASLSEYRLNQNAPWHVGAQTMDYHTDGAYTGEIAPRMLQALGVSHVIIGHSERRQYFNETDQSVQQKLKVAFPANLTPILCVGESLQERQDGQTDVVIMRQLRVALDGLTDKQREQLIIAYEPIWAIGTGQVCEASEANRVISLIRRDIGLARTRILYGGSMKPDNVAELMKQPDIDGGLVGGASLEVASFLSLVQGASLSHCA